MLAAIGIEVVGAYAVSVGIAFAVATVVGVGTLRPFVKPGPPAPLSELTPSLGWLLIASLGEAFMLNVGPVALEIVGKDLGEEAPGIFLNGLIISRVPLFFFQAVKAACCRISLGWRRERPHGVPRHPAPSGDRGRLGRRGVGGDHGRRRPLAVESLFGDEIGARDMALLSASGGRPDGDALAVARAGGARPHTARRRGLHRGCRRVSPIALLFANEPLPPRSSPPSSRQ